MRKRLKSSAAQLYCSVQWDRSDGSAEAAGDRKAEQIQCKSNSRGSFPDSDFPPRPQAKSAMGCNQSKAALLVAERSDASVHHRQPHRKTTAVTASPSPSEGDKSATMEPQRRSSVLEEEDVVKSVIDGRDAFLVGDSHQQQQTIADTSDSATSSGSEVPFTFSFIQVDEDIASGSSSNSANFAALLELSKGHHVLHPSLSSEEEKNKETDSNSSSSRSNTVSFEDAAAPEEPIADILESVTHVHEEVIVADEQTELVTAAQTMAVLTPEAVAEVTTEMPTPVDNEQSTANTLVEEEAQLATDQTEEARIVEELSAVVNAEEEHPVETTPEEALADEDVEIASQVVVAAIESEEADHASAIDSAPASVVVAEVPMEDKIISKENMKTKGSPSDVNVAVVTSDIDPANDDFKFQAEEVVIDEVAIHTVEATETKVVKESAAADDVSTDTTEPVSEELNVTAPMEVEVANPVATVQAVEATEDHSVVEETESYAVETLITPTQILIASEAVAADPDAVEAEPVAAVSTVSNTTTASDAEIADNIQDHVASGFVEATQNDSVVEEAESNAIEAVITQEKTLFAPEAAVSADVVVVETKPVATASIEANTTTVSGAEVADNIQVDASPESSTPADFIVEKYPSGSDGETSSAVAQETMAIVANEHVSEEAKEEITAPEQSENKQAEAEVQATSQTTPKEVESFTRQLVSDPEVDELTAQVEVGVESKISVGTSNEEEKAMNEEPKEPKLQEEPAAATEAQNPVDVETKVEDTAAAGHVDEVAATAESAVPVVQNESISATLEEKTSETATTDIASANEDVAKAKTVDVQDLTKNPEPEAEIETAPSSSASATVDAEKSEAVATEGEEEKTPMETFSLAGSTTDNTGSVKYQIHATSGRRKPIQRRYSEFSALHAQLQAANLPHSESLPTLPSSGVVNLLRWRANDDAIKQRERKFRALLDHINEHPELARSEIFQNFVQDEASV